MKEASRILLISNRFPPALDGIGDYSYHLSRGLAKLGYVVHVLCRTAKPVQIVERVKVHTAKGSWKEIMNGPLQNLLAQIQPDWLVLQYMPFAFNSTGLPFFLAKALKQIRHSGVAVWVTFHEVQIRPTGLKGGLIGRLQGYIARNMCKYADVVSTSIEFYKNLLAGFHSDIQLIPIGSNIELVALAQAMRRQVRQELFPGRDFIVSTFGLRNHSVLIQAVQNLNDKGHKIGLLICGNSNQTVAYSCKQSVFHTGFLEPEQISTYLQLSDLFALPDYLSNKGAGGTCTKSGSLAAAFANDLPVLGMRGDMTNRLLQHGENIWLVESNTVPALEKALQYLAMDSCKLQKIQSGGKALFHHHLAWERIAAQHHARIQQTNNAESTV